MPDVMPDVLPDPGVRTPDVAEAADAADATYATYATWRKISHLQGIKKDPVGNYTIQGLLRAHGLFYKEKPKSAKTEKK